MAIRPKRAQILTRTITAAIIALTACFSVSSRTSTVHGQTSTAGSLSSANVRIGVLGLFHPLEFKVQAIASQSLALHAGAESVTLEPSSGLAVATIQFSDKNLTVITGVRVFHASLVSINGRNGEPADFVLAIPGKISRRYHGTLEITPLDGSLLAIVSVDQETAVASVVAAESTSDTPLEALKAQAVAARSYFAAGRGRHHDFDFCDTTHCQFFRDPPPRGSAVDVATEATRDLVLAFNDQLFPAMYTRSCSGFTHTPSQVGIHSAAYPYYPVDCGYCRSHPVKWTTKLSLHDAAQLRSSNELSRLEVDRQLGWSTVPSNDFIAIREGDHVLLRGVGNGHGIGLCQAGAKAMGQSGATFREILNHYYPNTSIISRQPSLIATQDESAPRQK